jgi:hypothetical protein
MTGLYPHGIRPPIACDPAVEVLARRELPVPQPWLACRLLA